MTEGKKATVSMEIDSTSIASKVTKTSAAKLYKKEMEDQLKEGADKVQREAVRLRPEQEDVKKNKRTEEEK